VLTDLASRSLRVTNQLTWRNVVACPCQSSTTRQGRLFIEALGAERLADEAALPGYSPKFVDRLADLKKNDHCIAADKRDEGVL
jgi:hypothetical protein